MALVFMITREGRGGRQARAGKSGDVVGDGLDSRLFVVRDDRHRLAGFLRLGGRPLEDFDLAIDAENLRHLLLKLGVPALQVVAHLVRLDFFPVENLTDRCPEPARARHRCPAAGPCSRAWRAKRRVVHSSCG